MDNLKRITQKNQKVKLVFEINLPYNYLMKITIIGNCGSGKTTLANKISEKLNIPHLQLDKLWFKYEGHKIKRGEKEKKEIARAQLRKEVEDFIKQDSWVSDGWYKRVQPLIAEKADQIIYLDISLSRRLLNHLYRMFFTKRHSGIISRWEDVKFFYEIVRRTFDHGFKMEQFVKDNEKKTIILRSYKDAEKYLEQLKNYKALS